VCVCPVDSWYGVGKEIGEWGGASLPNGGDEDNFSPLCDFLDVLRLYVKLRSRRAVVSEEKTGEEGAEKG